MSSSRRSKLAAGILPKGIRLLHEDAHILVVHKPAGLLTMGTSSDKTATVYAVLTDYVRKGYAKSRKRVFIVHRLDRETSGVLVFAKSGEAKLRLQDGWHEVEKRYLAVVHGVPEKEFGTMTSYLTENRARMVYATKDGGKGKLSQTAWQVLEARDDRSMLELRLLTGRKHQIRVQLADLGYPIFGDRKYGHEIDSCRGLALHAKSLAFPHPATGARMLFDIEAPPLLLQLL
jgi:RluA family pseudouridine synthase